MSEVHLVLTHDTPPVPWRNGGGLTRELLAWPSVQDWVLRVSVADIESDGPFSAFPGVERWFIVLEGKGVVLTADQQKLTLDAHSEPHRFDGALAPHCMLVDGPTRDLNLMLRRDRAVGGLEPARAGEPRMCATGIHGLYTTAPGVLLRDDGAQWVVPAHALAWWNAPPDAIWRFTVEDPAAPLRAWWWECMTY